MNIDQNDETESFCISSEDLEPLVPIIAESFITMDTSPIMNDQDDSSFISIPNEGCLTIQPRQLRDNTCLEKHLKYPKNIDPFKINGQLVSMSIIILLICILFGVSFTLHHFIPAEFIEFGFCAIVWLQFSIMIFYHTFSMSWSNFLSDSGFYSFPKIIISKRTLTVFLWGIGVFLLSPVLLTIKVVCEKNASDNVYINCTGLFNKFHLMQWYLGVESVVVLAALGWHLAIIVKFKIRRCWPDIWHERLLEESPVVALCPLIKLSELRLDMRDETAVVEHDRTQRPTDVEIMQTQSYVIGYLRKWNGHLASRINALTRDLRSDLVTRVDAEARQEPFHDPLDSSSLCSSSNVSRLGRGVTLLS